MTRFAAALLGLTLSVGAFASDSPDVRVEDDGTVVARLMVEAPAADVKRAIAAVQREAFDNVLELRFQPDGACQSVFRKTRGLWSPLTMKTKLCPTQQGWREKLVQSDDYTDYQTEWVVRDNTDGATEMQLSVRTSVNLAVPGSLLRQGTISGMRRTFAEVLQQLVRPKAER